MVAVPSVDATAVSVVPRRADPTDARSCYDRDAAVVVPLGDVTEPALWRLLSAMFGDELRNVGEAVEVRAAGGRDRPDLDDSGHLSISPLHSDGFALADGAPDVVVLGCEIDATDGGGDSFVVDCGRLHTALGDDDLARFLVGTAIDQSEPGKLPCHGPIGLRGPGGRTWWRGSYCLAPLPDDPNAKATVAHIAQWQALLADLAAGARRFHLDPGDVLVLDNTRVVHGRDPYEDRGRLLWRLWAWTDAAYVPDSVYTLSDTSRVGEP